MIAGLPGRDELLWLSLWSVSPWNLRLAPWPKRDFIMLGCTCGTAGMRVVL